MHILQFEVSSDQMQCKSCYDFNTIMHQFTNNHRVLKCMYHNFKCDCETAYLHKQTHAHLVTLQEVYESVSTCIMCECLFSLMHTGRHHCDLTAVRFFTRCCVCSAKKKQKNITKQERRVITLLGLLKSTGNVVCITFN